MTITPEDCQILYDGNFALSLQYDAWDFSRYVAGKYRARPSRLCKYLTSALHLELKLGRANLELPSRYLPNEVEHNVWTAMSNRTTLIPESAKDLSSDKDSIFKQLREASRNPSGYESKDYDLNHLKVLCELREKGLAYYPQWAEKPPWRPPAMGTIGLSQRLVNMFYQYEFCWDLTYRPSSVSSPPSSEDMINWLPFLHAPLHVSFIGALEKLPLGFWLTQKEYIRKGKIRDSLENKFVTWWKMDSLRTYFGIQLLLRRIAMNTWHPKITEERIQAAIFETKSAFDQTFPEKQCKTHDWVKLACDFDNQELQTIISKTIKTLAEQEPCILEPADIGRKTITLCEHDPSGKRYENALRITVDNNQDNTLGAICYRHAELDLMQPQKFGYLIEDIAKAGGNFTGHPDYLESEDTSSHCWGGTNFEGGILFHSVDNAIAYLKQYFHINAFPENEFYTQEWVNWV